MGIKVAINGFGPIGCCTLVKVLAWYDNEWGYSCRTLDAARAWMHAK